jgi:PAS domain S-box-containing protein
MGIHTRTLLFHYGGAAIFTSLAVFLRWLLDPVVSDSLPLETLYGSVAFAVWLGGYRPALLATALGYIAGNYLFIEPRGRISLPDAPGLIRLILYLFSCVLIIALGEAMRVARRRAEAVQQDILEQNAHREREIQSQRSSEERFVRFMQHLPGLAWIKDLQGRYVYANDAAMKVFRSTQDELFGKTDDQLFPPQTASQFKENDRQALASDTGVQLVETLEHDDGIIHHSFVSKFPIVGSDGKPALIGGMAIDVTARLQAEEALKAADRRKNQFLATLAHELRNPLAPLRNAVEVLRCAQGNRSLVEEALGMIERQVGHMVRLIDDLLDISRITRGRLQLRKEWVELTAVLRTAVETSRPLLEAARHHFTMTLPSKSIYLDADPTRLAQVFSNLLNNAAKYTEKGGQIELSVERTNGEVAIAVRDSGIGIAAEHLPHLFEMFSQMAPALERSQGGLGIGLSLAKGLVELHGGRVGAYSGGVGKGSEFMVHLPITECPLTVAAVDGEKPRSGQKRRILVVDDNRDTADSLGMMLQLMGHDIALAHDGLEAVQAATDFRPDVVFLDIGLPRMNGYEVTRYIREQQWGKEMLIVAVTGWGQEEDKRRALEAGFDHHLTKPVGMEVLEKLLRGG